MKIKNTLIILVIGVFCCMTCACTNKDKKLAEEIKNNEYFIFVKQKALEIMKTGFNAGDGYREVWIRDYNTFIELAAEVFLPKNLRKTFWFFSGCRAAMETLLMDSLRLNS